jgi:UV DNA damage endonuclease
MIRLGVAVRVLGKAGLRARDGRRAEAPHLSVSLLLLREVLLYLAEQRIACYRVADDLAPDLARPGMPGPRGQVAECADLLAEVGAQARAAGQRLTMHLPLHLALSTPDDAVAARAAAAIAGRAELLDALEAGPDGTLVSHVGGAYGDVAAALHRFATRFERLSVPARRRLAVEPDEDCFSLEDLLRLHQMIGVPVVLDVLHLRLNNPWRLSLGTALGLALATWPPGIRPKVHFSSQRTEALVFPAERGQVRRILAPRHGQHSDYTSPFEFIDFLAAARGQPPFDVMLEAKAADLAVLRLREDLGRFAPDLATIVQ